MFKTLTDKSKAAIFTVIVLLLTVTVAASINLFSITSEFLSTVLYMFTPALTALIMMLVVTRDGFSREGWKPLGLHRLGLKAWWIAFLLPLVVGVVATALVWVTPLASFVVPDYGIGGATIDFAIEVVLATLTFSLGEELTGVARLSAPSSSLDRANAGPGAGRSYLGSVAHAPHLPYPAVSRSGEQGHSLTPLRGDDRRRELLLWLPEGLDG